jgi:hypothetical protein
MSAVGVDSLRILENQHATGELERLFAAVAGFLPGLSVTGDDPHKVDPAAPGLGSA